MDRPCSEQVHILRHALGLDDHGRGREYRNHFVSGPGCDNFATLREMVAAGLMVEHAPRPLFGGDSCFVVTEAGKELARRNVSPEKMTRSQRRYRDWARSGCDMTFGDWLKEGRVTTSHPILFNGAMVRAILEGRKMVTRRLATVPWCKGKRALPQFFGGSDQTEDPSCYGYPFDGPDHSGYMVLARGLNERHAHGRISLQSPCGDPGDTLWVKEAWKPRISHCCSADACDCSDVNVFYREGGAEPVFFDDRSIPEEWLMPKAARGKGWVSPLIMPRWASRILLRVTDVSVERVQSITEEDARREGVASRDEFAALWDSLAKPGTSWADNPWVWRVAFDVEEMKR